LVATFIYIKYPLQLVQMDFSLLADLSIIKLIWFFQAPTWILLGYALVSEYVHSVQQNSIGVIFRTYCSGSDVRYSCHHNSSLFLSAYLRIRGVSLSSIH